MAEEWLSSSLKLCQLTTSPNTETSHVWDPVEASFNTQSYPQPDYDQSSIFTTLEAYSSALDETQARRSDVENLKPKPVEADIIHQFADMLAVDILDATVRRRGTQFNTDRMEITDVPETTKWTISDQEMLAKKLASEIFESALEELAQHSGLTGGRSEFLQEQISEKDLHCDPYSSMHCCDHEEPDMEVDYSKMEENESKQPHERLFNDPGSRAQGHSESDFTAAYSNTLSDMANMGSLDYPDAPPSTPLLPEMMKSRASFTRKLKGGLAMEFLPSPPPPTPKDQQSESLSEDKMTETVSDKSEFMVRLMRSLSLACSQHGEKDTEGQDSGIIGMEDEGKPQNRISTLSDYAAWLSEDIINCITAANPDSRVNRDAPVRDVQLLAHHLAQEIIIMSVAEVMGTKRVDRKNEQNSHMSNAVDGMASCVEASVEKATPPLGDILLPSLSPPVQDMEVLRALAGRLIAQTLVQAVSELEKGIIQRATRQQLPGEASEAVPSEARKVQGRDLCLNTTTTTMSKQTTSTQCCNGESVQNYIMSDSRTVTSTADFSFAEKIACEVLKCSMQEASNSLSRSNQIAVDSERLSTSDTALGGTEQTVLKGFIPDKSCQDVQELQCILLWAAASHTNVSVLQLDVSDTHIQQQLCSLSLKAQFHSWTVEDLLVSVLQYCEDPQTASRGQRKSDRSLLGHLLLL
ncbi:hypothetical protein AMEX_G11415 [Astyanax mexicanus]|uniref:Uncharacterized protein n=1 Tax=Astyanax mexicanus TaxID=7994 RepID=A0A8T2M0F6_ASTMX|nr:hypothetical protein AMEX_G11415 [Astyanax mexicanus]